MVCILRDIPESLEAHLRQEADRTGRTLEEAAMALMLLGWDRVPSPDRPLPAGSFYLADFSGPAGDGTPGDVPPPVEPRVFTDSAHDVAALRSVLGLGPDTAHKRDLSDLLGSWGPDPELDAALADFRRVDPGDWK